MKRIILLSLLVTMGLTHHIKAQEGEKIPSWAKETKEEKAKRMTVSGCSSIGGFTAFP
ncbi:MAG: hypothetical protein LBV43_12970 [Prevotella sp.]|jgi:hypothetical protein|nr:hypothetical protein [Prevotella sp.]